MRNGAQASFLLTGKNESMKINILFVLFAVVCLTACGDKTSEAEKEAAVIELLEDIEEGKKSKAPDKINDCDDFLDTFENWTLHLIALMENHEGDPIGLATDTAYTNTMLKGVDFMQDWATISVSCATNDSYETRMKAIQEHMEKRQKELGF